MIATRFNPLGVRGKPYAYEVEWIMPQASSLQYIEVPVNAKANVSFRVYGTAMAFNSGSSLFSTDGAQFDSNFYAAANEYMAYSSGIGGTWANGAWTIRRNTLDYFELSTEGLTSNGEYVENSRPLKKDFNTLSVWKYGTANSAQVGFRNLKIEIGGALVRDLIAVVDKQGVACMYDNVSGQLFYNKGTGVFATGERI